VNGAKGDVALVQVAEERLEAASSAQMFGLSLNSAEFCLVTTTGELQAEF
jgi:hypothetical protein